MRKMLVVFAVIAICENQCNQCLLFASLNFEFLIFNEEVVFKCVSVWVFMRVQINRSTIQCDLCNQWQERFA